DPFMWNARPFHGHGIVAGRNPQHVVLVRPGAAARIELHGDGFLVQAAPRRDDVDVFAGPFHDAGVLHRIHRRPPRGWNSKETGTTSHFGQGNDSRNASSSSSPAGSLSRSGFFSRN